MAKCDVTIQLDEPERIYPGGGTITGTVRVLVDADVACNGLEVMSVWRTHGRGNTDAGQAGSQVLFAGNWQAGDTPEYRFELPIADWPPTYHGHYLNVDHYVDARAKISWSFDPKASVPFKMQPTCGPEKAKLEKKVIELRGFAAVIASVAFLIFLIPFGLLLLSFGIFALLILVVPVAAGIYWFMRFVMPRYLLGDVHFQVASEHLGPGDALTGEVALEPRKRVSINGLILNCTAREQCVSGSGSNRTTHKHTFFEKLITLQDSTTLQAGRRYHFPFEIGLPQDAPHSMDLDDNELIWSTTLRVDIPRWPDWVKTIPISVLPKVRSMLPESIPSSANDSPSIQVTGDDSPITFSETARHLWSVRDDREEVEMLVEAVSGFTFDIEAQVERRLLYAGDDDPHVYKDGYAVWAHYPEPKLPMVMYVPHDLADEFEQSGTETWRGKGTIVGWDGLHSRLQIKVERPK